MHRWTLNDDKIALYLYKYGNESIKYTNKQIAGIIGTSVGSLEMRKKQYKYLDGKNGLSNTSSKMQQVYNEFKNISFYEYKAIVERLLWIKNIFSILNECIKKFKAHQAIEKSMAFFHLQNKVNNCKLVYN